MSCITISRSRRGFSSLDASNMFKPALAVGDANVWSDLPWTSTDSYIEKDGALARRFQMVMVDATNTGLRLSDPSQIKDKV